MIKTSPTSNVNKQTKLSRHSKETQTKIKKANNRMKAVPTLKKPNKTFKPKDRLKKLIGAHKKSAKCKLAKGGPKQNLD